MNYTKYSGDDAEALLTRLEEEDGRTLAERVACYRPDLGGALSRMQKKAYRGVIINLGTPKGILQDYEGGPELNCVVLFGGERFMACFRFRSGFEKIKALMLDGRLNAKVIKVLKEERGRDGVGYRPILCKTA